jgi:hypothetical protein
MIACQILRFNAAPMKIALLMGTSTIARGRQEIVLRVLRIRQATRRVIRQVILRVTRRVIRQATLRVLPRVLLQVLRLSPAHQDVISVMQMVIAVNVKFVGEIVAVALTHSAPHPQNHRARPSQAHRPNQARRLSPAHRLNPALHSPLRGGGCNMACTG